MSVALDFSRFKTDRLLQGSAAVVATLYSADQLSLISAAGPLQAASSTVGEMVHAMWWGVLLGVLAVGILGRISRETVVSLLGPPGSARGILRAAGAGVLLDLCSHGILMVGVRLYERGASAGQVMAFLVASPWNSLSLTFILIGLIGAAWTGVFIALSFGIALTTGWAFDALVRRGRLPTNPEPITLPETSGIDLLRADLAKLSWRPHDVLHLALEGLAGARMVLRWILFGVALAALVRALFDPNTFSAWFGPTLAGLGLTLLAATLLEVCSEGSTPIAADLMNRARAPGNSFTFLMAGVATDYTEIMAIKDSTGSWRIALFLPLLTVPQILVIAYFLNRV